MLTRGSVRWVCDVAGEVTPIDLPSYAPANRALAADKSDWPVAGPHWFLHSPAWLNKI